MVLSDFPFRFIRRLHLFSLLPFWGMAVKMLKGVVWFRTTVAITDRPELSSLLARIFLIFLLSFSTHFSNKKKQYALNSVGEVRVLREYNKTDIYEMESKEVKKIFQKLDVGIQNL